jgi:integrase
LLFVQIIEAQPCWSSETFSSSFLLNDLWFARQPSTVQQYCYAVRRFFGFCAVFEDRFTLPIDAVLAARYLSYLKQFNGKIGAVKTAFNAMKWLHNFVPNINKFNDPLDDKIVKGILSSALRTLKVNRNVKAPLDKNLVATIMDATSVDSSLLNLRDSLIICLAFSLLLRHDEVSHLNCSHILKCSGGLKVLIPSSKTDILRNGKFVFLARDSSSRSVYNLLFKYLDKAGLKLGDDHFLFGPIKFDSRSRVNYISNYILSYSSYRNIVRGKVASSGLNPDQFGFHSCRSGAASAIASSVSEFELLCTGRWKDPRSIRHYVEIPDERRLDISKRLFVS